MLEAYKTYQNVWKTCQIILLEHYQTTDLNVCCRIATFSSPNPMTYGNRQRDSYTASARLKVANLSFSIWPRNRKLIGKNWKFWDSCHESRKRVKTSHHFFFPNFNSSIFEVLNELWDTFEKKAWFSLGICQNGSTRHVSSEWTIRHNPTDHTHTHAHTVVSLLKNFRHWDSCSKCV